jgi:hypothetical protein
VGEDRERTEPEGEAIADTVEGHVLTAVPDDHVEGHLLQESAVADAAAETRGD